MKSDLELRGLLKAPTQSRLLRSIALEARPVDAATEGSILSVSVSDFYTKQPLEALDC